MEGAAVGLEPKCYGARMSWLALSTCRFGPTGEINLHHFFRENTRKVHTSGRFQFRHRSVLRKDPAVQFPIISHHLFAFVMFARLLNSIFHPSFKLFNDFL